MGLVGPDGELGAHRRQAPLRRRARARWWPTRSTQADYADWIGEAVEPWSYLKFPYYKPLGYPDGIYRVGPAGPAQRLQPAPARRWPTTSWRSSASSGAARCSPPSTTTTPGWSRSSTASSAIEQLLDDPEILSDDVRAVASRNRNRGVGACEAPRGTLFHDYQVDGDGLLTRVNLLIATGQNNLAMNRTVAQIARHFLSGPASIERGAAQPGRGRHPRLRPLPLLLDPRGRPDAPGGRAARPGGGAPRLGRTVSGEPGTVSVTAGTSARWMPAN